MLLIQALPLLALVALLASGRAGPPAACATAIVLALPSAWLGLPGDAGLAGFATGFVLPSLAQGAWLAVVPVAIITGGLVFHACVIELREAAPATAPTTAAAGLPVADQLFTTAFLLGPFSETVTGFGVGTVFAVGAIRALGLSGAPVAAIGLLAQPLIPWGGLGPGSAIGAALAGVDPQAMALRNAFALAPALLALLPLFWWWCGLAGVAVPWRSRAGQAGWVAAVGTVLILCHRLFPWELCGMLATGTVLSARLLLARPPRDAAALRQMLKASLPYALLVTLLLASRLWRAAPALHPFEGLPSLPLNHAAVALWVSALVLLAMTGRDVMFALRAVRRARRPALALLSFVVLARVLTNASIPVALAASLVAGFGAAASFASPLMAAVAGFFAGTNVGSNSAMMPLQAALGRSAGLGSLVLPAVQNGTLALVISPQLIAVASALAGRDVTPASVWRIMWPIAVITIVIGTISILIG